MSNFDQLFDHQAELQQRVDRLSAELLAWVVMTTALVVLVGAMALEIRRLRG